MMPVVVSGLANHDYPASRQRARSGLPTQREALGSQCHGSAPASVAARHHRLLERQKALASSSLPARTNFHRSRRKSACSGVGAGVGVGVGVGVG